MSGDGSKKPSDAELPREKIRLVLWSTCWRCGQSILQSFHHDPQSLPSIVHDFIPSLSSPQLHPLDPHNPEIQSGTLGTPGCVCATLRPPRWVCLCRARSRTPGLRTCIEGRHNAAAAAARLVIQSSDQTSGTPPPCRARLTTSPVHMSVCRPSHTPRPPSPCSCTPCWPTACLASNDAGRHQRLCHGPMGAR